MMNSFFAKLDEIAPGYSKKIYTNFADILDGKCRNPFQFKATVWALETEFSKATQKQELSGNINVSITNYGNQPTPQLLTQAVSATPVTSDGLGNQESGSSVEPQIWQG